MLKLRVKTHEVVSVRKINFRLLVVFNNSYKSGTILVYYCHDCIYIKYNGKTLGLSLHTCVILFDECYKATGIHTSFRFPSEL